MNTFDTYTAYTQTDCEFAFLFIVSSPDGQYEVNLLSNTCTCEAFVYGRGKVLKRRNLYEISI